MMKKILQNLMLLTAVVLTISCTTVSEEQLVGAYTFDMTEHMDADAETPAMDMTMSGTTQYNADKSVYSNGTLNIGVQIDEDGYSNHIALIFHASASGTWKLEDGNKLSEEYNPSDVLIDYSGCELQNQDEQGAMIALMMLGMMDGQIEQLKEEMAAKTTAIITSLDKTKMVLKDEETGEKVEFARTDELIAAQSGTESNQGMPDGFMEFIKRFDSDREFRAQRVAADVNLDLDMGQIRIGRVDEYRIGEFIVSSPTQVIYSCAVPETDNGFLIFFTLIDGKWMCTNFDIGGDEA